MTLSTRELYIATSVSHVAQRTTKANIFMCFRLLIVHQNNKNDWLVTLDDVQIIIITEPMTARINNAN